MPNNSGPIISKNLNPNKVHECQDCGHKESAQKCDLGFRLDFCIDCNKCLECCECGPELEDSCRD
jgi:hypothetical protein